MTDKKAMASARAAHGRISDIEAAIEKATTLKALRKGVADARKAREEKRK